MGYEQFIGRFSRLGKPVSDLSRAKKLMAAIGDPQKRLKFVHIAGTNGKGSTAKMLADALTAAGYRTGLFTSPYILRYNDRIRVDGREVSDEQLDLLAEQVEKILTQKDENSDSSFWEASQFEITQAMALLHFVYCGCDVVVFEAGLGGALDSTNVIPPPLVSVITSVSLDHTEILGNTIADIARHKAGIIKRGSCAAVAGNIADAAAKIIAERAAAEGAPLTFSDFTKFSVSECTPFGSRFCYRGREYRVMMGGRHQIINALTVIETVFFLRNVFGFSIPDSALDRGLSAQVPARLQVVSRQPLVIVDGGHNPEGVAAMCEAVDSLNFPENAKPTAIVGMARDKDSVSAAARLVRSFGKFICVEGFSERALPSEQLKKILENAGAQNVKCAADLSDAFEIYTTTGGALVICGSLYLAGAALTGFGLTKIFGHQEV